MKRPIKYEDRFKQSIIFDGLQDGLVSPTDIDFCFEVGNKFLLVGDCKKGDAPFPTGQRLVLERLVDSWNKLGRKSIAIIATHNTSTDNPIILAETVVTKFYTEGKWHERFVLFKDFIRQVANRWDIEKLKNLN